MIDEVLAEFAGREPACGAVKVLAIDGRSGAGKTSLAGQLSSRLKCPVFHIEDVYAGWHGLQEGITATVDVLHRLSVGDVARPRRWDWDRGTPGEPLVVAPTACCIVEGVGAFDRRILPMVSLALWIDADDEERKARALGRDGDLYAPWWDTWAQQEESYLKNQNPRAAADFCMGGDSAP